MFQIHPGPSPVVAVTAGTARLLGRSIASHAGEFFRLHQQYWKGRGAAAINRLVKVEHICEGFLKFMHDRYTSHYEESSVPEALRPGPEFLVGGFGRDDPFPSIYRVSVQNNSMECDFSDGKCGISWNGQSTAIERFIRGYDKNIRLHLNDFFRRHEKATQSYVADLINDILAQLDAKLPEGIEIEVPPIADDESDWERFELPLECSALPLQEAVNLASAMVMVQASHSSSRTIRSDTKIVVRKGRLKIVKRK